MRPSFGRFRKMTSSWKSGFMAQARTEYAVPLALAGVLLSIGIPAWQRGELRTGAVCIVLGIVVLAWTIVVAVRTRR
jgi:hypothetical protein